MARAPRVITRRSSFRYTRSVTPVLPWPTKCAISSMVTPRSLIARTRNCAATRAESIPWGNSAYSECARGRSSSNSAGGWPRVLVSTVTGGRLDAFDRALAGALRTETVPRFADGPANLAQWWEYTSEGPVRWGWVRWFRGAWRCPRRCGSVDLDLRQLCFDLCELLVPGRRRQHPVLPGCVPACASRGWAR